MIFRWELREAREIPREPSQEVYLAESPCARRRDDGAVGIVPLFAGARTLRTLTNRREKALQQRSLGRDG